MARRRRRRPLWFPIIAAAGEGQDQDNFNSRPFALSVQPGGLSTVLVFPIIPDKQVDGDTIAASVAGQLIQHLGNSYELERIVGKLFLACSAPVDDVDTIFPKTIQIGAGFFVARQADEQAGGGADLPIGAASQAELIENYSPLSEDTVREPWIWHRTWILSTGRFSGNPNAGGNGFIWAANPLVAGTGFLDFVPLPGAPRTNIGQGLMDGPHVDARSGRRVGGDERLWFAVAVRTLDFVLDNSPNANAIATDAVKGVLQVRVLGFPRAARKRSAF